MSQNELPVDISDNQTEVETAKRDALQRVAEAKTEGMLALFFAWGFVGALLTGLTGWPGPALATGLLVGSFALLLATLVYFIASASKRLTALGTTLLGQYPANPFVLGLFFVVVFCLGLRLGHTPYGALLAPLACVFAATGLLKLGAYARWTFIVSGVLLLGSGALIFATHAGLVAIIFLATYVVFALETNDLMCGGEDPDVPSDYSTHQSIKTACALILPAPLTVLFWIYTVFSRAPWLLLIVPAYIYYRLLHH